MNCGEKIAELRKKHGMTQDDLGKAMNVSYQAVSKWERDESQPDFDTMTKIAKLFNVPLGYFAKDGEAETSTETVKEEIKAAVKEAVKEERTATPVEGPVGTCTVCGRLIKESEAETLSPKLVCKECAERERREAQTPKDEIAGTCTVCGKLIKESETASFSPKLVCKECAERKEQEKIKAQTKAEQNIKAEKERSAREILGHGFDVPLIVSLVLSFICYVALTVVTFLNQATDDVMIFGSLTFLCPLALFGCTHAIVDAVREWRDRDSDQAYTRNLSLIIGACFAAVNLAVFLTLFLTSGEGEDLFFLILLFVSVVLSFTFVSQFMWGGVVKEIFTAGGFTFKLPGFIITLDIDSVLWMIVAKFFLGILAVIVFIVTTVLFAVIAVLGSVFIFIPSVLWKTGKDHKAKQSLKD